MATDMDRVVVGQKIKSLRPMNQQELEAEGWTERGVPIFVIELENGLKFYPSRDTEGNGGGALFGMFEGKAFGFGGQ